MRFARCCHCRQSRGAVNPAVAAAAADDDDDDDDAD